MSRAPADAWQSLVQAGLTQGEPPRKLLPGESPGESPGAPLESPWFVRLLLGFAGWIAALFLLGFVAAALAWVVDNESASIGAGLLLCFAAWLLFRKLGGNDFAAQFALALSFAGQGLYAAGVFGLRGGSGELPAPWLWLGLLQAALLAAMPNAVHRLWSGFAAAGSLYMALKAVNGDFLAPPLLLATAAWAWLREFHWPRAAVALRPAAYGLVLALIVTDLAAGLLAPGIGLDPEAHERRLWAQAVNGLVLLAIVRVLLRRAGLSWPGRAFVAVLAGTLAIAAVSLEAPGMATGLSILLLGFAHGNAVLSGLGGAALLLYLGGYYYELDTTLLVKSQVMAATGAVLLSVRWLLLRWGGSGGRNA